MQKESEKIDRYEQILAKYDWQSERPPRGYQYGVGRGAKAFVTTAELSVTTMSKATIDEENFFAALDRVEHRHRQRGSLVTAAGSGADRPGSMSAGHGIKLSLDDLSTVGAELVEAPLVTRAARDEKMTAAEEHIFADERVVTAHDLLRGRTLASQQNLHNLLSMGSPDEQTTWVTHSRAYREMGMFKKAQQTLIDGCALTGRKGSMIWEERLSYIPHENFGARRRLLEEATEACPDAEVLWFELLECEPPHELLHWLQKAVISCPSSERLWLQVVQHASSQNDQRKIIQKALQRTPHLPLLWSKLARLSSFETGKDVFRAASEKYPSVDLVLEAIKYVEWNAFHRLHTEGSSSCVLNDIRQALELVEKDAHALVRAAQEAYLVVNEEASRQRWLDKAKEMVEKEGYTWTAAYLYAYFVLPKGTDMRHTQPASTWVEDLMAFVPQAWSCHSTLCAVWGALLLFLRSESTSVSAQPWTPGKCVLDVIRRVVETADDASLQSTVHLVGAAGLPSREENETVLTMQPSPSMQVSGVPDLGGLSSLPSLTVVLAGTLATPHFASSIEASLVLAKAFFVRSQFDASQHILERASAAHQRSARIQVAMAKTYAALGHIKKADACLLQATRIEDAESDIAWVKLCILRRSLHQDIAPVIDQGLTYFPHSERLWLMRLEYERALVKDNLAKRASGEENEATALIKRIRASYEAALSEQHCHSSVAVWVYVAVQIEALDLSSPATARALLQEAAVACGAVGGTANSATTFERGKAMVALGVARAKVELRFGGQSCALDVVKETLQQLPKALDGSFVIPPGELLELFIDLEPPATRGRAAAQVVRTWKSREALALVAVAKLYHIAEHYDRALQQAVNAVTASEGRCGDAVALLWKLSSISLYHRHVGRFMGVVPDDEETVPVLSADDIKHWVWQVALGMTSPSGEVKKSDAVNNSHMMNLKPNYGPLWVEVAKVEDPANVTLLGYRDSVEDMLHKVVDRIHLSK